MASSSMKLILLPFLGLIVEAQNSSTLNCLVDYKAAMNCTWKDTNNSSHVSLQVYLRSKKFWSNCTFTRLLPTVEEGKFHTYFCTMKIKHFAQFYSYILILKSSSQAKNFTVNDFRPSRHIQLKAPCHLSVTKNSTAQNVNISWQVDALHYLNQKLQYELEYWSKQTKEDVKMKSRVNDIRHLLIEKADLEPDSNYRGRVRVKPIQSHLIQGQWSKWSAEITWRTEPDPNSASIKSNLLCVVVAPLLLAVIIFISLYLKLPSRVVSKVWIHIPNPASYFQPLYNQHNGNFKEWIHKNHASVQHNSSGSCQEVREVKRVPEGSDVTVILNPWDEAVSDISYLKPILINQTSTFDLDTKASLETEFSNPFQHPQEYCNNDSTLLSLILQEEQGVSENCVVCHDPSHGTFLATVPQEEDGGYSYSEEYCTLAHPDNGQGLVPAKIELQLKVANKCQGEKREVAEDLPVTDDPYSTCPAVTENTESAQEDCAGERPSMTAAQGQSPAGLSEPPANIKEPSRTLATPDNSAVSPTALSEILI
ncbi:interleukin-2 receptor subunit beta-like [Rhinoraja longicauda]